MTADANQNPPVKLSDVCKPIDVLRRRQGFNVSTHLIEPRELINE